VEVGEPTRQDEEARSVIRAHVMRDFYGKRRQGKEPNYQAEILSAASSKEGVSQQARRFKNGPNGLQELAKKRKKQCSGSHKTETSPPLDATCIAPRENTSVTCSPQFLFAHADGGEDTPFTLSGNCIAQSRSGSGDGLRGQDDSPDPGSRDEPIRSDSLVSVLGSLDPFDTLPIPNNPRTQILIYHGVYSNPSPVCSELPFSMNCFPVDWFNDH
jgi:hypothetical protein